jgi:hypothetical protein
VVFCLYHFSLSQILLKGCVGRTVSASDRATIRPAIFRCSERFDNQNTDSCVLARKCLFFRKLLARHPAVLERIAARRQFVRDELGVTLKDSILPLSSTPLCLPPFWLAPRRLLARS